MKTRLNDRDIDIITDVARFQLLTTRQLHRLHFPAATENTASGRLSRLTSGGYLVRVFSYPRATTEGVQGRPSAIYLFPPKCQKKLQRDLESSGRASRFDDLADYTKSYNHSQSFAQQSLQHELALSDVFLGLENAVERLSGASVAFWERTSPRHPDLTRKFRVTITNRLTDKTRTLSVSFNPDGFFALRLDNRLAFFFVEIDNDTAKIAKVSEKNAAYIELNNSGKMREIASVFLQKNGINIELPERVGFRVLTLAPNQNRVQNLFLDSTALKERSMFYYATIDSYINDPLGQIWHRKKEFLPYISEYRDLKEVKPSVRRKWVSEKLSEIEKVSLIGG